MLAEIRNMISDSAIGAAKNVTAEFVFRVDEQKKVRSSRLGGKKQQSRLRKNGPQACFRLVPSLPLSP